MLYFVNKSAKSGEFFTWARILLLLDNVYEQLTQNNDAINRIL